jgi:1-phosphofructokinase family hexose kinase
MDGLIVTLTANPAIDQNFATDRLAFDDRSYLQERSEAAGGRGVNASLVLHSLGAETLAIVPCGGPAGDRFEEYLRRYGFPVELVRIRHELRTNYAITDRQGLTVKLDELGPTLDSDEVEQMRQAVLKSLAKADWLLLCGSLPPGVPADFYRDLIEEASAAGVRTLLDAGGAPLLEGLEVHPTVVAPNQLEAERLLDRALVMRSHFHEAAELIQKMGAESVILSLGNRGAVVARGRVIAEVIPPRIDAVCPIGAGDALNAAFVWSITQGNDFVESVRWGVAAGSASARLPGLSFASPEQIRELYAEVEVRIVS